MNALIEAETGCGCISPGRSRCLSWVKACIPDGQRDVRSVPTPDSRTAANSVLFDHRVGALQEEHRDFEAERLGGLEIDHELELDRNLNRQLARFCSLEKAISIHCRAAEIIKLIVPIRKQTAEFGKKAVRINGRHAVAGSQRYDLGAMAGRK